MTTPSPTVVAIIGAGVAGLSAARRIGRAGVQTIVYEKSRGVSGRVSTRHAEPGLRFDHGAQYFTARDPRFQDEVTRLYSRGAVALWRGELAAVDCETGAVESTDRAAERWVGVPGMNALGKHLAEGIDVRFETQVEQIERDAAGWRLVDTAGVTLGVYQRVLVTAPAPQAAALLAAEPGLSARAASAPMTGCWALMAAFDGRLPLDYDGAFVNNGPLSWVARNSSKPGRPADEAWVVHASPVWSEANLELPKEAAAEKLLELFFQITGARAESAHAAAHRWRYALPAEPLPERVIANPSGDLLACGDWCGGPRVEGAYLSGLAAAERILEG